MKESFEVITGIDRISYLRLIITSSPSQKIDIDSRVCHFRSKICIRILKRILAISVVRHKSTDETDETRKDENRPRRKHQNNAICSLSVCLANDIIERKPLTFLTSPLDRNVSPFRCFPTPITIIQGVSGQRINFLILSCNRTLLSIYRIFLYVYIM